MSREYKAVVTAAVLGSLIGASTRHVLTGSAVYAQSAKKDKVVQAERIEVVDQSGTVRVTISVNEKGEPGITLVDETGKERVWLGIDHAQRAARLVLSDRHAKLHASLEVNDTLGSLRLNDLAERNRVELSTTNEGISHLAMLSPEEKTTAEFQAAEDGKPFIEFYNKNEKRQASFGVDPYTTEPYIQLYNKEGAPRVGMVAHDNRGEIATSR